MERTDAFFFPRRRAQKEGSGSLIVAHCSQRGVFTVRQQRCLAAVALCLRKCSVRWSELLEVMADSRGRLAEREPICCFTHTGVMGTLEDVHNQNPPLKTTPPSETPWPQFVSCLREAAGNSNTLEFYVTWKNVFMLMAFLCLWGLFLCFDYYFAT